MLRLFWAYHSSSGYDQVWVSVDKLKHLWPSLFATARARFTKNKRKTTEANYDSKKKIRQCPRIISICRNKNCVWLWLSLVETNQQGEACVLLALSRPFIDDLRVIVAVVRYLRGTTTIPECLRGLFNGR